MLLQLCNHCLDLHIPQQYLTTYSVFKLVFKRRGITTSTCIVFQKSWHNKLPRWIISVSVKQAQNKPAAKWRGVDFLPAVSFAFTLVDETSFLTLFKSPFLHASNNSLPGSFCDGMFESLVRAARRPVAIFPYYHLALSRGKRYLNFQLSMIFKYFFRNAKVKIYCNRMKNNKSIFYLRPWVSLCRLWTASI